MTALNQKMTKNPLRMSILMQKNLLNFNCCTMKFYNCHQANVHQVIRWELVFARPNRDISYTQQFPVYCHRKLKNMIHYYPRALENVPQKLNWAKRKLDGMHKFLALFYSKGQPKVHKHNSIVGSKPILQSCGQNSNIASASRAVWV